MITEIPEEYIEAMIGPWGAKALRMSRAMFNPSNGETLCGFTDSHIHIDRARTHKRGFLPPGMSIEDVALLPLRVKQGLLSDLHNSPAYSTDSLRDRMSHLLETKIALNEKIIYGIVDTTPDIGLRALEVLIELKKEFSDRIQIKTGSYCVFGFSKYPSGLDIFREASAKADFIVGLPEKDDTESVDGESFESHISRLLETGFAERKQVQIHLDQQNSGYQKDSFRALTVVRGLTPEKRAWLIQGEPKVYFVHMISPSCYSAEEFFRLVKEMKEYNIGLIVCPTAAISMRNLRSEKSPLHNSIARIAEAVLEGLTVRIGTDNVNDIFVPSSGGSILGEITILSNVIRFYDIRILVKLAMNMEMHGVDLERLSRAVSQDQRAYERHAGTIADVQKGLATLKY